MRLPSIAALAFGATLVCCATGSAQTVINSPPAGSNQNYRGIPLDIQYTGTGGGNNAYNFDYDIVDAASGASLGAGPTTTTTYYNGNVTRDLGTGRTTYVPPAGGKHVYLRVQARNPFNMPLGARQQISLYIFP